MDLQFFISPNSLFSVYCITGGPRIVPYSHSTVSQQYHFQIGPKSLHSTIFILYIPCTVPFIHSTIVLFRITPCFLKNIQWYYARTPCICLQQKCIVDQFVIPGLLYWRATISYLFRLSKSNDLGFKLPQLAKSYTTLHK